VTLLKSAPRGEELANSLMDVLYEFKITRERVTAFIQSGASTNNSACGMLRPFSWNSMIFNCCSRTARLSGLELVKQLPLAAEFVSKWSELMCTSNTARSHWMHHMRRRPKTANWSCLNMDYVVAVELGTCFSTVLEIIRNADEDFEDDIRDQLKVLTAEEPKDIRGLSPSQNLELEIALYMDIGKILHDFILSFEGDNLITPFIYDRMVATFRKMDAFALHCTECSNTRATAVVIAQANDLDADSLVAFTVAKALPARDQMRVSFMTPDSKSFETMQLYRSFAVLKPNFIISALDSMVRNLLSVIFDQVPHVRKVYGVRAGAGAGVVANAREQFIYPVMAELALYRSTATTYGGSTSDDLWKWWVDHVDELPSMKLILQCAVVLHPSTAAAERVFGMAESFFSDEEYDDDQELKETGLMLRYNKIWREKTMDA
jgi:hypothetical protein